MVGNLTQAITPSFLAKLERAEHHLAELRGAIEIYRGTDKKSRPYTVQKRIEGKRASEVWRLHFTQSASNTNIPIIAADAIYNLRSGLDHLMSAMVPPKKRGSVMFPIFWRTVWRADVDGENEQRRKDRERWRSDVETLPDPAVEYLKRLQPPDDDQHAQTPDGLRLLNQLSNKDRHARLPVVAHGVHDLLVRWQRPNGSIVDGLGKANPGHFLEDGAKIDNVPKGAVMLDAIGSPNVVVRTALVDAAGKDVNLPVVDFVGDLLKFIRESVVPQLVPFVRKSARRE